MNPSCLQLLVFQAQESTSTQRGETHLVIRVGSQWMLGSHAHISISLACYTTLRFPSIHSGHHLILTAKKTSEVLFGLCRNIKDILVNTYVTSSTTILERSLALYLPSVPIQGGKCPLTERKLAQRLCHASEFSEGICKQTR